MTQTDSKRKIVKINFPRLVYNALKNKEIRKLSEIANELFLFIDATENLHYLWGNAEVNLLEGTIQNIESELWF